MMTRQTRPGARRWLMMVLAAISLLTLSACGNNMRDYGRIKPYEQSEFFPNGQSARPLVENTVARGYLKIDDEPFYTGKVGGQHVTEFPIAVDENVLKRGQSRFNIYCSPCHAQDGYGNGMIVQRGFPTPPSFHQQRLIDAPPGYFFDVITNGFGVMYSYASRIPPNDRWAIVAYIRALQLSQNGTVQDVPANIKVQGP